MASEAPRDLKQEASVRAFSLLIRVISGAIAVAVTGVLLLSLGAAPTHGPGIVVALFVGVVVLAGAAAFFALGHFVARHGYTARLLTIACVGLGAVWGLYYSLSSLGDAYPDTLGDACLALDSAGLVVLGYMALVGNGAGRLFTEEYRRAMRDDPGASAKIPGVFKAAFVAAVLTVIPVLGTIRGQLAALRTMRPDMTWEHAHFAPPPRCGYGTSDPYCQKVSAQCCRDAGGAWTKGSGYAEDDGQSGSEADFQAKYGCCSIAWPADWKDLTSCREGFAGASGPSFRCASR